MIDKEQFISMWKYDTETNLWDFMCGILDCHDCPLLDIPYKDNFACGYSDDCTEETMKEIINKLYPTDVSNNNIIQTPNDIQWHEYTGEILDEGFYLIADTQEDTIFRCYKIVRYGHEIHHAFTNKIVGYNQFYKINENWEMDFYYPAYYAKINKPNGWVDKDIDKSRPHCDYGVK